MQRQWTEEELLCGLRARRSEAIEAFFDLFGDRLLRGAYLLISDHHGAEDVVQETFVAALRNIKRFRGESGLYTWLYRIMVNQCRMLLRKKRPVLIGEVPEREGDVESAEALVTQQEERQTLTDALGRLPYIYREAITLHYYLDMTVDEMADAIGCPPGTVKSRLLRGRRQLGDLILEVQRIEAI